MKFRSALLAATLLAVPVAAKAQPIPGLYVSGGAGANFMSDEKVSSFGVGTVAPITPVSSSNNKIRLNTGFAGMVSVGYSFGPITPFGGPRLELEGLYTDNSLRVSTSSGALLGVYHVHGTEQKYGGFLNAIWDFDVGSPIVFPYLGVGAGGLAAQWRSVQLSTPTAVATVNNTQGGFAYQGIAGVSFAIPPVPGLSVFTDFRFEGIEEDRTYHASVFATGLPTTGVRGSIKATDDYNYTLMAGVKYAFNAAPPPPPPAPPPVPVAQPSRSYLVFFDWDRYNLTDRARQIISEAAANSTRVQYTRIQVNGYTDTSGTPKYNQGLSIRRAQSVAAELVKDGVPKGAIAIQGFGETHLLVQTGPGVREPQNRRVEIIIQ